MMVLTDDYCTKYAMAGGDVTNGFRASLCLIALLGLLFELASDFVIMDRWSPEGHSLLSRTLPDSTEKRGNGFIHDPVTIRNSMCTLDTHDGQWVMIF
jgi:hypothetical protein